MTVNISETLDTYDELERTIYWCIPEDNAAIKAECGGWIVEITPKDRKNYKLRQAFDLATQSLELRYLLDRLKDLDGLHGFNESYYDGGWWDVSIHYKGEPSNKQQRADNLRNAKTRPSVTVRDKSKIVDYEGRAVQVTEFPAMTVITLWKEIEYK